MFKHINYIYLSQLYNKEQIMSLENEIKSNFKNEYHKAVLNIRYTNNFLAEYFESAVSSKGITSQQYNVLRILRGQKGTSISISSIKERLLDKNADVSRMISRLERKELVKRSKGTVDKRQNLVSITNKGLELVEETLFIDDKAEDVLGNLTKQEAQTLNELLDKIRIK